MNKYVLGIDGMLCGMCELHVEEAIAKGIKIKKAKASRFKKQVVVFTELNLDQEDFKKVLDQTGYRIMSFERMPAIRKLFGWR